MKKIFTVLSVTFILSACSKSTDTNNCNYNPCDLSAPSAEVTAVESYLSSNSISATKHCSGYYFIIDAPGAGTTATICSGVSVKYKGQLTSGTVFDQTTSPVNFNLNSLIEAWKKGLMQIKPGGKIRMWAPPALCYGSREIKDNAGNVIIPANSILYFEIELIAVL